MEINCGELKSIYMQITPELADEWLKTSKGNPRWKNGKKLFDKQKVDKIANDIVNGNWNPGNNSIGFNKEGNLLDGHHRLMAITVANIPVFSLVTFGIDKKGELHIDENDVEAAHSCSVGSVNLDHLYYLQTRGFSYEQAKSLLIKSYFPYLSISK